MNQCKFCGGDTKSLYCRTCLATERRRARSLNHAFHRTPTGWCRLCGQPEQGHAS